VQKELRLSAKLLNDELLSTKKIFVDLLPEKDIKDIILKDLRGYIKKSFGVITNPNYSVDPNSKIFTDAVGFVKKIINSDRDLISQSINRFSNLTKDQARTEYAKELVLNILRTGKINSNNPMKALEEIGKQIKFDKIINTGEELPSVIKKLLGEEKNLRSSVVNTISEMYTNISNKYMMDQLADILVQQGYLYCHRFHGTSLL
jgi:polyhydroxyalkanoate synthesis regulator phasin